MPAEIKELDKYLGSSKDKKLLQNPIYYRDNDVGGTPIVLFVCKQCTEKARP
jgi:hypothetical protein